MIECWNAMVLAPESTEKRQGAAWSKWLKVNPRLCESRVTYILTNDEETDSIGSTTVLLGVGLSAWSESVGVCKDGPVEAARTADASQEGNSRSAIPCMIRATGMGRP